MNNREQYKRMLNFLANAVILFFQGMCFAYIWYEYYSRVIFMPFFRRGNWAVVGMYVLILFFFTRVMGGYKVGYLRISDICLSQLLAILASNVIGYLQICMIGRGLYADRADHYDHMGRDTVCCTVGIYGALAFCAVCIRHGRC